MLDHPDVEVRVSGVHGRGAFARRPFAAGEPVIAQEGRLHRAATIPDHVKGLQVGQGLWLLADPDDPHPSDEINHACEPNLGHLDGTLLLFALRPIAAGEELTFDYSTVLDEPGWSIPCACGLPTCRGAIQAWSDLPPAVRDALRHRALAWLRDR